eukprot:m.20048 g.20048  ORF g.20048 m.20048 type:complete len:69 (+) comp12717_c0_seq1:1837-2043(+)
MLGTEVDASLVAMVSLPPGLQGQTQLNRNTHFRLSSFCCLIVVVSGTARVNNAAILIANEHHKLHDCV